MHKEINAWECTLLLLAFLIHEGGSVRKSKGPHLSCLKKYICTEEANRGKQGSPTKQIEHCRNFRLTDKKRDKIKRKALEEGVPLHRPDSQPSTPVSFTHHGLRLVLKHGVDIPDDELDDLCVVFDAKALLLQVAQIGAQQHLVVGRQALDVRLLLGHLLQGVLPEKELTW